MITKSIGKFFGSLLLAGGVLAASGTFYEASAQRDPFVKPTVKAQRVPSKSGVATDPAKATGPLGVPSVEARVNYYMNVIRPQCIAQGCTPMPKPTVVMTLDEMSVVGISRTPRGYAAIVELKPINLSYTIYPGEKFFDGQLVAVEDNHLVFRKVTKMSNGKFAVAEEKKILRRMSFQEEMARNTIDALPSSGTTEAEKKAPSRAAVNEKGEPIDASKMPDPNRIEFPLDELKKAEKEVPKDAKAKPAKGKTVAGKKKN
jgi:Tfp pilus assembly protein PilP